MSNIISLEDLEEDEDYEALLEDLREGCEKLGTVLNMHVPRIHVEMEAGLEGRAEKRRFRDLGSRSCSTRRLLKLHKLRSSYDC